MFGTFTNKTDKSRNESEIPVKRVVMCEQSRKQCFYSVLQVEETASIDDIRKSYRFLALRWHPDKNPDDKEVATEQFRLIQEAYDCLSDPKERIWYDKHKDLILRGHCRDEIVDQAFDVFPYFLSSCYSGFSDNENGFYTVYRNVFESIAKEDIPFTGEDSEKAPGFGDSKSPYEEVHRFYAYWQSYFTEKSFAWLDKYDILTAPNRRCVRLMEKENKKLRDAAKKKRSEEIRQLVAFVRRRDKRVKAQKKANEMVINEKRKKTKEFSLKQIKEKQKEFESFKESEWTSMSTLEQELKEIENNLEQLGDKKKSRKKEKPEEPMVSNCEQTEDGDEDFTDVDLYCIACDKTFKSLKSFENHENSKKHKNNVKELKANLEEDQHLL